MTLSAHGSYYGTDRTETKIPENLQVRYYVKKGEELSVKSAEEIWAKIVKKEKLDGGY